ncbi:DNA/RNA non-specific endonuclease [Trinorchestia longiramus]|nr:DNA/RNA non-specific endonuclease [Trinorchestia longiramus]
MRNWWINFRPGKWTHLLSVGAAAGGLGYWAGAHDAPANESHSIFSGIRECQHTHRTAIFPSSLFTRVSAATKVQESLIVQHEDVISEPPSNAPRIAQIMRYGFPSLSNVRSLDDFVLSYDTRLRIPQWVFEHLIPSSVMKNDSVDRSKCDFHEDGSVHQFFSEDTIGGYHKGATL